VDRYREIPSFGRDTIRRFAANSSELKKMAAHNFENLLQVCLIIILVHLRSLPHLSKCAIPVFDGLLPEPHNHAIKELLFVTAHWHAMAKLRMHNDITLDVMEAVTISLGKKLRAFSLTTCSAFVTKELRREYNGRIRREARAAANKVHGPSKATDETPPSEANSSLGDPSGIQAGLQPERLTRRRKTFNLSTFKGHSLGDYVKTIRYYGTTDSYSTEPVRIHIYPFWTCTDPFHSQGELEHRSPKARYTRTSRKRFIKQMTQIERRQARLRRIRAKHHKEAGNVMNEDIARSPEAHHHIGKSQNFPENICSFVQKNRGDPAVKVVCLFCALFLKILSHLNTPHQDFVPKLKDHIIARIKDMLPRETSDTCTNISQPSGSASQDLISNRNSLYFKSDHMYRHHLARFNYTTYDVRRSQDVINPNTSHRDIMLLANNSRDDANGDAKHPFLYARVLGIYHVNAIYTGDGSVNYAAQKVDFLWVRWFEYNGARSARWADMKLDALQFPPMSTEGAFGFVDPKDVLRGCHIIPNFSKGKARLDGVGLSRLAHDAKQWSRYYVNRYCPSNMIMNTNTDIQILALLIVIWLCAITGAWLLVTHTLTIVTTEIHHWYQTPLKIWSQKQTSLVLIV
jgi:hypothetical protein